LCFGFILGALALLAFTLTFRVNSEDGIFAPTWVSAGEPAEEVAIEQRRYLVRPEAASVAVNIVKDVHQRPPATDAEAVRWIDAGEMVPVEPGTAVKRIDGRAPGYAVCVEVVNGRHQGLRGWVWEDSLRDSWP
jgi:hypothetical protein